MIIIITYVIMGIIVILFLLATLFNVKKKNTKDAFFDNSDTVFLKGFWAIVIILVHIPIEYQNTIQDMIGSFAYIGVTFFFIASAYGLKYGTENKKNYLDLFFDKRIIKLIVPMLVINTIFVIMKYLLIKGYTFDIKSLSNPWVIRLLVVYIIFWLFHEKVFKKNQRKADLFTICFVIFYSLLGCIPLLRDVFSWNVEILGFVFGVLLYNNKIIINSKTPYIVITIVVSLVAGLLYLKFKYIPFLGDYLLRNILGFALSYLVFQLVKIFKFGNMVNHFIGSISYEIYLCHIGLISILSKLITNMNSGVFVAIIILMTIILSYMTHLISNVFLGYIGKKERVAKS